MNVREELNKLAEERILILDGGMGSLIQAKGLTEQDYRGAEFAAHSIPLLGCFDLLCLTRPGVISGIHEAYLDAGADIISTCSFNATAVSLADYGIQDRACDISRAAACLAREAVDKYRRDNPQSGRRFVAGSMGPTSKSLSISSELDDPGARGVTWDELEAAYYGSACGLVDGGADIILLETFFDTLNAKAALFALARLFEERGIDMPVIVSATISGASGRILSGATIEAFVVTVLHAHPWALGLNCSLGAEKLLPHLETLAACSPVRVSCHPNAGLPNRFGGYDEGPEQTAAFVRKFFERSLVNVIGGCCGTTPEHIAAIAKAASSYRPRKINGGNTDTATGTAQKRGSLLAGLELLDLDTGFVDVGERTNVAGSKKFLRLVQQGKWEESLDVAREMINAGAGVIDVCMDDALLDGPASMTRFLNLCISDPEIARAPIMVDSSSWETLEAALKCMQGKGLVNSISLKEGETEFLRRARLVRRYGAAVVVMLFDEEGQAVTFEKRIAVAERCWKLLTSDRNSGGAGFPPGGIVFDPNVLTIATGMAEHDRYALDFIRACAWIREHCPGAHISGGISNLSFSFRGNNPVRRALHTVFLKHAIEAGLSMAILNPADIASYDEIPPELREAAETAVLCRGDHPSEKIIALALAGQKETLAENSTTAAAWRESSVEERIRWAMLKGIDTFIEEDVLEIKQGLSPLEIVEGPLMKGMREVGARFGEGGMFLPQVIRSARVMKKAVAVLEPFMEKTGGETGGARKIVMATVKGDVHDIGKNIAAVVMGCNGYNIVDLGVMVPCETIVDAAETERAGAVGLSGLISPSLEEMVNVAREMERRRFTIPLLIGGAAASLAHTALRIAPVYSGPVVYVRDAGESALVLHALFSPASSPERLRFLHDLERRYDEARSRHGAITEQLVLVSLEEARANNIVTDWKQHPPPVPKIKGVIQYDDYPIEKIIPHISWDEFYRFWGLKGNQTGTVEKETLRADAENMLCRVVAEKTLTLRAVLGFFPAVSEGDDVVIYEDGAAHPAGAAQPARFCFLRNQVKKAANRYNPCLADYVPNAASGVPGWIGLFALSAGFGFDKAASVYRNNGDDYSALLLAALADRLAEAFSAELHRQVMEELWVSPGIRPAFGYPVCPDHHDKEIAFRLLRAREQTGMELTESAMILPAQSVCGMYFARPDAAYFGIGPISDSQNADWARRKGITEEEARRRSFQLPADISFP